MSLDNQQQQQQLQQQQQQQQPYSTIAKTANQQQTQQIPPSKTQLQTPNLYTQGSTPLSHRSSPAPPRSKEFSFARTRKYHGVVRLNKYKIIKQLGKGTFGVVFKGQDRSQNKNHYVAIKRIIRHSKSDGFPITAFREITILKELQETHESENIIELLDMIHDRPAPNDDYENYDPNKIDHKIRKDFFMVFPYMSFDLTGILGNPDIRLQETDIKSIMQQLLKGINFIHAHHFLHRDIKASNILLDVNGIVKIADFGLARDYIGPIPTKALPGGGNQPLTEVVMTRWYRAPEVLFGDRNYTTAVDIWGIGCVFGELYERKPILPGKSDLQQVYDIFALVGDANLKNYPTLNMDKINEKKITLKTYEPNINKRFGKTMYPEGVQLLKEMLTLYPMKRITGLGALDHAYFHSDPLPTETVTINFAECHEADIPKFKEQQKSQQQQQQQQQIQQQQAQATNPLSRRPPAGSSATIIHPNKGLPPKPVTSVQQQPTAPTLIQPNQAPINASNIQQPTNQGVTRPRSNFIKDNRQQRSAHPQDLETPPPVQYNNHNNYNNNYNGGQGNYHDYRRQNQNTQQMGGNPQGQPYRQRNYGNWGNSNNYNNYGGYQDDFSNSNSQPLNRQQDDHLQPQQPQQPQQSIPSKRPYPNLNDINQQMSNNGVQYYQNDQNRRNKKYQNDRNNDKYQNYNQGYRRPYDNSNGGLNY